jgi:hypothetical protein
MGIAISPGEADAPLIVDPNAELTLSISLESFQSIARRNPKLLNGLSSVQHQELSHRSLPNRAWKPASLLTLEDSFRVGVGKALDHWMK